MENKKKSFFVACVPILVVIALTALIVYLVVGASQTSRDSRRVADVRQLRFALDLYFSAHGSFPQTIYESGLLVEKGYIPRMPYDPDGAQYAYVALQPGGDGCTGYVIGASLEKHGPVLETDADFDSSRVENICGGVLFDGADQAPCGITKRGHYCYDLKIPS